MTSIKPFVHLLALVIVISVPLQSAVPVEKEPRHHVKFKNKYVSVIDASVAVGDATLFHIHALDNVPVAISGGKLKTELQGQQATFSTVETGAVSFAKATYTHRITNVGDTPLRFIDAQILAQFGNPSDAPPPLELSGGTLALDHERVRIYKVFLEPGVSTGQQTHKLPGLLVAVTGGKVAFESAGRKAKLEKLDAGDFRWYEKGVTRSIRNAGESRIELVIIEWK